MTNWLIYLLTVISAAFRTCNALSFEVPVVQHGSLIERMMAAIDLQGEFDDAKAMQTQFEKLFPGKVMMDELQKFEDQFDYLAFTLQSTSAQSLIDFYSTFLAGNITLGTPAQVFQVGFNTGTADFWVVDKDCVTRPCQGNATIYKRRQFNKTASSTYSLQNNVYDSTVGGVTAKGVLGKDQFYVAGIGNANQTFGLVNNVSVDFTEVPLDGIFGLGFPTLSPLNTTMGFDGIKSQLDKAMFSVFVERKSNLSQPTTKGLITYGKKDESNCVSTWNTVNVSVDDYWQFTISGLKVGNFKSRTNQEAILYTFAPFITGPSSYVEWIVNATSAVWEDAYNLYSTNCSSTTLPDIVFTIGGKDYAIPPNNYLIQLNNDKSRCFLTVQSSNLESLGFNYILGAPFLRSFCTAYNFDDKTIGFANTKW